MAHVPVLGNKECNKYFRGRVRENEMCSSSFQGGVGACEVRGLYFINHCLTVIRNQRERVENGAVTMATIQQLLSRLSVAAMCSAAKE